MAEPLTDKELAEFRRRVDGLHDMSLGTSMRVGWERRILATIAALRDQLRQANLEVGRWRICANWFETKHDAAIERAEAAEALVARLKEAAIRRVVRSVKPRLWCCGLCGDWWADGEAPCHTNTCVLYLAPAEAQGRQKEARHDR